MNQNEPTLMIYFGSFWFIQGHYGSLWFILGHYGSSWFIMGHYGSLWLIPLFNIAEKMYSPLFRCQCLNRWHAINIMFFKTMLNLLLVNCSPLKPPLNGAVITFMPTLAQIQCISGYHPDRPIAYLYKCQNNKWIDPSGKAKLPLPDCLGKLNSSAVFALNNIF